MVSYIETGEMEKGLKLIETVGRSKNWQNKAETEFFWEQSWDPVVARRQAACQKIRIQATFQMMDRE